jgi:predicted phosphoadenosine phosphosulfate sulfurtransferase
MKTNNDLNVLEASRERIKWTLQNFERVYLSFSMGKDSTVMFHLVMEEAKKLNKKVGVLTIDLEGMYDFSVKHTMQMYEEYKDNIEPYWVCLPLRLRSAVSVYEPYWKCWDKEKKEAWIRPMPENCISDVNYFPFFVDGMEFEEFVPEFAKWYSQGKSCACMVGIRTQESLNRFRTIANKKKDRINGYGWTTKLEDNIYNVYPIYDWKVEDIWTYHGKNPDKRHNILYDYMHKAGVPLKQQRVCEPYGDDQRRNIYLFQVIEPRTWAKVVARVNGANSACLYINETGNINGYNKITKPEGHTWKSFANLLVNSMPPKTGEHFKNKIWVYIRWWSKRGYKNNFPDETEQYLVSQNLAPSWKQICKSLLRNDFWCKGLGFSQTKSHAYEHYLEYYKKKREEEKIAFL